MPPAPPTSPPTFPFRQAGCWADSPFCQGPNPLPCRNAYNMVLHKHGEILYRGVCECVRGHLEVVVGSGVAAAPDTLLLSKLSVAWAEHKETMVMVRDILMYMDRTFVPAQKKLPVYDHGTVIFRDTIARHPLVTDTPSSSGLHPGLSSGFPSPWRCHPRVPPHTPRAPGTLSRR